LTFESLEGRRLLALTNLAAIEGTLFYELPGDVERPISGQPVRLYQDGNGNGLYDGAPTDPLQGTQLTNADGYYRFDSLAAATYFVEQPPEPSGHIHPAPVPLVRTIVITPDDADGIEGVAVDLFDDGVQSLTAQLPEASRVSDSVSATSALGGHRQVIVSSVSGPELIRVQIDQNDSGVFRYSESDGTSGNVFAIWDGTPGVHLSVNPTGLGSVDMTGGGIHDSFLLKVRSNDNPAFATFTVYTDATRVSQATIALPETNVDSTTYLKFCDFTPIPGLSPASFSEVGAVTFAVQKDPPINRNGLDYSLYSIGSLGTTVLREVLNFPVSSSIQLVKWTNGMNREAPPGPLLPVGGQVAWTYLVTNEGNESLASVVVTDDNGTPGDPEDDFRPAFVDGDINNNNLLEPGEVWRFEASDTAIADQYVNVGTATGIGVVSAVSVRADGTDFYFGVQSEIDIEKATNGLDADKRTGPVLDAGDPVTWTYVVTNPGNVPLWGVVVSDDNGTPDDSSDDFQPTWKGGDDNGDERLDPGETWRYEAAGTAQEGLYGNAATAIGVDPIAQTRHDMDPSHYFGVRVDPASGPQPIVVLGPDKSPSAPQTVRVVNGRTWHILPHAGFVAYGPNHTGGTRIAVADLDGNKIDEIITAPGRNHAPEIKVFTLEGDFVPGFPGFPAYPAPYSGGVELTVADVNGDGKPDIITVPSYGAADVRVFFNRFDEQDPSKPSFNSEPDVYFLAFPGATTGGAVVAAADMGGLVNGSFGNARDGKAEIVVGTGGGTTATVSVFDVSGTPTRVRTFSPFTTQYPNFLGGVSLDVAWIDPDSDPKQDPPDILVGMGVNGTSRIEVWSWDTTEASLAMRGAIPHAFTDSSDNAPVRVAAMDTDGNGRAEMILAVQGPVGATGEIHRFEILGTSPFLYQQATPLNGFSGPWFIATGWNSDMPSPSDPVRDFAWTNADNAYDVNDDGVATPLDVLEIINFINLRPGEPALPAEQTSPPRFFDCNVDRVITPADVLFVVHSFNTTSPYSGEGESREPMDGVVAVSIPWDLGRGLEETHDAPSSPDNRWDQASAAFDVGSLPSGPPLVPDVESHSPLVPNSPEPPLDGLDFLELEPVLEEIAAEIAAS
jgi:hypothetical protein